MNVYDVIVVGAGIEGSSTAYHLADKGAKVLLFEQFDALHTRGSSHGGSRTTRRAYVQPYYVAMMNEAFLLWDRIEKESAVQLYIRTGILQMGPSNCKDISATIASLRTHNVAHQVLSGKEVNEKYPKQLSLPEDYSCVFEEDGGILLASKALSTLQSLFRNKGGTLLDNHQVTSISPGPVVTVTTNKGDFQAQQVIITAGAWSKKLIGTLGVDLPFKVIRSDVLYWKVEKPELFLSNVFPVFGAYEGEEFMFYGAPIQEYPGLIKICCHEGLEIDPDHRDAAPGPVTTASVARFIGSHFKSVSTTPSIYESCICTISPDEDPVLDRHPQHRNIIIGAGFSGHGFKLGPVVGKILCELAFDVPLSYDLTPFRLERLKSVTRN